VGSAAASRAHVAILSVTKIFVIAYRLEVAISQSERVNFFQTPAISERETLSFQRVALLLGLPSLRRFIHAPDTP